VNGGPSRLSKFYGQAAPAQGSRLSKFYGTSTAADTAVAEPPRSEKRRKRRGPLSILAELEASKPRAASFDEYTKELGGVLDGADIARQTARGLAESGYATAIGASELVNADDAADALRRQRADAQMFYGDAESPFGKAAHVGARVTGDLAQFMAPGAGATRLGGALARAAAARGMTTAATQAARIAMPVSRAGEFAKNVATGTPLAGIMSAGGAEESGATAIADITGADKLADTFRKNAALRVGADLALDVGLTGVVTRVAIPAKELARRQAEVIDLNLLSEGVRADRRAAFRASNRRMPRELREQLVSISTFGEPAAAAEADAIIAQLNGGPATEELIGRARAIAGQPAQRPRIQPRTPVAETAPAPAPPPTAAPVAPRTGGRAQPTFFPGTGAKVNARYVVREADELVASHDPFTFNQQPQGRYPGEIQGRAYHGKRGAAAREQVITQAQQYDPDRALDPTIDVTNGPPLVTPHGIAVAGNQRVMLAQRAARLHPERFQAYREALEARAAEYGIDPEQVRGMRAPVLVREIDDAGVDLADTELLRQLNAASDVATTKAKDVLSDAATRASDLRKGAALRHLTDTMPEDATIRSYLESRAGGQFVDELVRDGVIRQTEKPRFIDVESGAVTQEGKQMIERLLRASAIGDADVIERATASSLNKLDKALPAIIRINGVADYALEQQLRDALDLIAAAKRADQSVGDFAGTVDMFGRQHDDRVVQLATFIDENPPRRVAEGFRSYAADVAGAESARQSDDIFGYTPPAPEEAFARHFGEPELAAALDPRRPPVRGFRGEYGDVDDYSTHRGSITFASDRETAELYSVSPNSQRGRVVRPRVLEADLDIQRPIVDAPDDAFIDLNVIERELGRDEAIRVARRYSDWIEDTGLWQDELADQFGSVDEFLAKHPERVGELYIAAFKVFDDKRLVKLLRAKGYDGAIHAGYGQNAEKVEYRVFDRAQVRKAGDAHPLVLPGERVTHAALRLPDGSFAYGRHHYDAFENALEDGRLAGDLDDFFELIPAHDQGFRTTKREFVSRDEGGEIARTNKQLPSEVRGIKSAGFRGEMGLDSNDFLLRDSQFGEEAAALALPRRERGAWAMNHLAGGRTLTEAKERAQFIIDYVDRQVRTGVVDSINDFPKDVTDAYAEAQRILNLGRKFGAAEVPALTRRTIDEIGQPSAVAKDDATIDLFGETPRPKIKPRISQAELDQRVGGQQDMFALDPMLPATPMSDADLLKGDLDRPAIVQESGQSVRPAAASSEAVAGRESTIRSSGSPGTQERVAGDQTSPTMTPPASSTARTSAPSSRRLIGEVADRGAIDPVSGRKILQPTRDLNELFELADQVAPRFQSTLEEVAEATGAKLFGSRLKAEYQGRELVRDAEGRVIPSKRAMAKFGDTDPAVMNDVLGGRLWLDNMEQSDAALRELEGRGWKVAFGDDDGVGAFANRGGYRARHVEIEDPETGLVAEVQFVPREIAEVQEDLHLAFNELRGDKGPVTRARFEELQAEIRAGFDNAWDEYLARTGAEPATGRVQDAEIRSPFEPAEPLMASSALPDVPARGGPAIAGKVRPAPKRSRAIKDLEKALGFPIRTGRLPKRRWLGVFFPRQGSIRLRDANDLDTLGHEVGHALQALLFPQTVGTKALPAAATPAAVAARKLSARDLATQLKGHSVAELQSLANEIGQDALTEGWAEFWRRYLTNVEAAKRKAPSLFNELDRRLEGELPAVKTALEKYREQYTLWTKAGPDARIEAHISTQDDPTHFSVRDTWQRVRTNVLDDMNPLEQMARAIVQDNPAAADVAEQIPMLARLVRGAGGQAEMFLEHGVIDFRTLEVTGKSMRQVLEPVKKDLDEFRRYAVALRARELEARGVHTGIELADAEAVIERGNKNKAFRAAARELQDYNRGLLAYLRDSGVISAETFESITTRNRFYVPFYRVLPEEKAAGAIGGSSMGHLFNPVHRIKGSSLEIVDPFESIIKNTVLYTQLAAKQQVSTAIAQLEALEGMGRWVRKIPSPQRAVSMRLGELRKQLGGISEEFEDVIGGLQRELDDEYKAATAGLGSDEIKAAKIERSKITDELLAVFRPGDYFGKPNVISVLKDGQREWYEIDENVFRALEQLDKEQINAVFRFLAVPARTLRAGATLAPEFALRNPIRDQVVAFVQSEHGFRPFVDPARGLFHLLRKDGVYQKWLAGGGARASLLGLDRNHLRNELASIARNQRVPNVVKNPLDLLRAISSVMEDATRVGEFVRATESLGTGKRAVQQAAAASREVTIDFARAGAKTQALRQIAAFWNVRLQGYDRLFRAAKKNPQRFAAATFASITAPSLALYYLNRDDPEYWEIPQWQRDLFWMVKVNGQYWRIPKPFELGLVFGTLPERVLEWHDSQDPKGLREALRNNIVGEVTQTFVPIPTFVTPLIENFANYSLFMNRPIVPTGLQNVEGQEQYREGSSSEIAKGLGRLLNYSPAKIDNVLRGYTGGLGRYATNLIDTPFQLDDPARPTRDLRERIPGVKGFATARPLEGAESVERFYQALGRAETANSTLKLYEKMGRWEQYDRYAEAHEDEIASYDALRDAGDELAKIRASMNLIRRDPDLTAEAKREQLEELGLSIQQIARDVIGRRTPANRKEQP
jgi:hypothetical protein